MTTISRRRIAIWSTQMPLPKSWSLLTMSGRSTFFTGTPPRSVAWIGPRSPIRFDAIQERTWFGLCYPNPVVRYLTGSSMGSETCRRSRCSGVDLSLLPVRSVFDRMETLP